MPKIVDHDEYRKALLKESFECFAQKGYSVVTMRELAKHIGVSTGTLYHYFPSKKAIFEAVIDYMAEEDSEVERYMIARGQTQSSRVDALFSFLADQGD